jgi:hypothetical protein
MVVSLRASVNGTENVTRWVPLPDAVPKHPLVTPRAMSSREELHVVSCRT